MAARKMLFCFAVLLIVICAEIRTEKSPRQKRGAIVVKAISQLASFAIDKIFKKVLDGGASRTSKELDSIIKSLDEIETMITEGFADIDQSLKEIPSFVRARETEAKLLTKIYNYQTLLNFLMNNGNNHTQEIVEFKKSLKDIPDLLFEFHLLITGKSRVAAGLLSGIARSVVNQQLKKLKSAPLEHYNVTRTVHDITDYMNSLITLQVASIQIYFYNCPDASTICQMKLNDTYGRIATEVKLFEELTPGMFDFLAKDKKSSVFITDTKTKGILYTNQNSSIVTDGIMDWERIESPQDAGLKCPRQHSNEKWTLEDSSIVGRKGYFLKQGSGCFLSIDRPFIDYTKSFPLIWTNNDRIDRYNFLICLPIPTSDAVTFFLYANTSNRDTAYTVLAHHTAFPSNKYLHVEEKKTSVYEDINRRLYLTLFLSEKVQTWFIGSEITNATCDDSVVGTTANREDDKGIVTAIGWGVGGGFAGILLLVMICVCWFKRECLLELL